MTYVLQEEGVVCESQTSLPLLVVETPAWYAWLAQVTLFTFKSRHGTFSARKERTANGRGDYYWRAYRKSRGKLYRVYLGKSEQLTMTRLTAVAQELARRVEQGGPARAEPSTENRAQPAHTERPKPRATQNTVPIQTVSPLLRTKLHIPPFQKRLVSRPRLVQLLNRGATRRLVLLSASAGSGKTTLLSEWAQQSPSLIAWLTLDKEDNDPVRFWSYVLAALRQASLDPGEYVAQALRSPAPQAQQSALIELLNVLDRGAPDVVLVLDDYHLIETEAIHDAVVFLLEHLPAHVHLVLATRSEPPFALGQWRVRRWLFELHSTDLRFIPAEAAVLFQQAASLALSEEDLKTFVERTEGWVAGLQLAALALQGQRDISHVVASFQGSHRFISSYLLDEILKHQPDNVERFLLATSVLERFTAPLCDALTGEGNGQAMLKYLEQKNLFLSAQDDEGIWYRYHHLLTEALRSRLREAQPARFFALHRQASIWFEQHALLKEAVQHALAAEDFERAADLMEHLVDTLVKQNEFAGLRHWLDLLPPHFLTERPWLCLASTQVFIASGHLEQAEQQVRNLARFERVGNEPPSVFHGKMAALKAHLFSIRGQAQEALVLAHQALALLPENDQAWRLNVLGTMGGAYLHAGKLLEAEQTLQKVVGESLRQKEIHRAIAALHPLGQAQILLGRLDLVNTTYLQGLQLASQYGLAQNVVMGSIHAGRGNLLYEWNDLAGAEEHLLAGLELARRGENLIQALDCTLTLADVRQAQERIPEALALLRQAEALAGQTNDRFFLDFVRRRPVYLWLAKNDVDAASRCARVSGLYQYGEAQDVTTLPSTFFLLIELLMLARLYVAQGDLSRANRLLSQLAAPLKAGQNERRRIQWRVIQALALQAEQRFEEAEMALACALELAEPMRYMRTFADMGDAIIPLFKTLLSIRPLARYSHSYLKQLLTALGAQSLPEQAFAGQGGVRDLLTRRELAVLRCLAEGHSDREIAQQLVVTEHTVKTHTRRIYSKLDVHSRTQAIAYARAQGLL